MYLHILINGINKVTLSFVRSIMYVWHMISELVFVWGTSKYVAFRNLLSVKQELLAENKSTEN